MHVYRCANGDYLIAGFELARTHDADIDRSLPLYLGEIDHRHCGFEQLGAHDAPHILVRLTREEFFRTH